LIRNKNNYFVLGGTQAGIMEKEDTTNANTNDHSDQNKLLPMTQWALDPVFYATAKLSIRAILQAPQYYDFNSTIENIH
jgi:hypothetical protein